MIFRRYRIEMLSQKIIWQVVDWNQIIAAWVNRIHPIILGQFGNKTNFAQLVLMHNPNGQ
jgi:hypothetical protein